MLIDATACLLAESWYGRLAGVRNAVLVAVSEGVGAAILAGGQLHSGYNGLAGEFGHMVIVPDGPLCNCGNRGCLEAISSGTAIARAAGVSSAFEVGRLAAAGDLSAQELLGRAARYVGLALGGLINLLNPEAVAVGGGVLASSPKFWADVLAGISDASFPSVRGTCRVERAALGEEQGLLGAVELGLDYARRSAVPVAEVALP